MLLANIEYWIQQSRFVIIIGNLPPISFGKYEELILFQRHFQIPEKYFNEFKSQPKCAYAELIS